MKEQALTAVLIPTEAQQESVVETPQELRVIIEGSKIPQKEGDGIASTFSPYFSRIGDVEKKLRELLESLDSSEPTKEDMQLASALGKAAKNNRIDAEKTKKARKENIIVEGRLIDSIYNLIETSSKLIETKAEKIAKYPEIKEKQRLDTLEAQRREVLRQSKYASFDTTFINVREMSSEAWNNHVAMMDATLIQREEEARLKLEMEEKSKEAARIKREAELAEMEKAKAEAEKSRKEAEAARKQLEAEKAKAEAARKKAELEKKKIEDERLKVLAEIENVRKQAKLKEDARIKEEQEKEENARRAAQEAADKLAKESDYEKIERFISGLESLKYPELKSPGNVKVMNSVEDKIKTITNYYRTNVLTKK